MAQRKKTTPARKRKNVKSTSDITLNVVGILFLLASLFAIFKLGFVGVLFANCFRLFVGDSYPILAGLIAILGFYMLVTGKFPKLATHSWLGGTIGYFGMLLFWDALFFAQSNIHNEFMHITWIGLVDDFQKSGITNGLGGGLIGSAVYGVSYFLFSQIGTYIISVLIMLIGAMLLANVPMSSVINAISKTVKGLFSQSKKMSASTASKMSEIKSKLMETENSQVTQPVDSTPEPEVTMSDGDKKLPPSHEQYADKTNHDPIDLGAKSNNSEPAVTNGKDINHSEETALIFPPIDDSNYTMPPSSLLADVPKVDQSKESAQLDANSDKLQQTFASFGVHVDVVDHRIGPTVTKYEIRPAVGVKVSKIVNLADDLALALAAKDVRIEAPIPGKSLVGIEVPNQQVSTVGFKDVIEARQVNPNKPLEVPLGKDISGQVITCDLTKMPHLLIAGSTGSGKSVAINGIITSILMQSTAAQVKMMLIDPKMVELSVYNGVPHLLTPVVTDSKKASSALQKVVAEMERRYQAFADVGQRNIAGFNKMVIANNKESDTAQPTLPYMVVVVDELADLMMVSSKEVEDCIIRIAQMGRAAGIHMIVATQRPSVDVITGLIKANVPSRIAFAVSSGIDSRTILDMSGAEKLLGRGDMLYLPMGMNKPIRVQGAFISDSDVEKVVEFITRQQTAEYDEEMMPVAPPVETEHSDSEDELFDDAVALVVEQQTASVSMLQRRFRIGYSRAARIVDEMEQRGIVSPPDGSKPRKVYKQPEAESPTE